jgi:hypothetical protein
MTLVSNATPPTCQKQGRGEHTRASVVRSWAILSIAVAPKSIEPTDFLFILNPAASRQPRRSVRMGFESPETSLTDPGGRKLSSESDENYRTGVTHTSSCIVDVHLNLNTSAYILARPACTPYFRSTSTNYLTASGCVGRDVFNLDVGEQTHTRSVLDPLMRAQVPRALLHTATLKLVHTLAIGQPV